jgi:hypothetical protein
MSFQSVISLHWPVMTLININEKMTTAGRSFLEICEQDGVKKILGLEKRTAPASQVAKLFMPSRTCSWADICTLSLTLGSGIIPFDPQSSFQQHRRFQATSLPSSSARRGKGGLGSFVRLAEHAQNSVWRVKHIIRHLESGECFLTADEHLALQADDQTAPEITLHHKSNGELEINHSETRESPRVSKCSTYLQPPVSNCQC